MSSAFVATPFGTLPKQENFKIAGIFNTFVDLIRISSFKHTDDALSIFDKNTNDQNLEIYLKDPLEANNFTKKFKN